MVESTIRKYLTGELTDCGFKENIQAILDKFEGKRLLHQNIGQLAWKMKKENPNNETKFKKIWILLDQVNPRIRRDLDNRMKKGQNRIST
jgi:hypothetical protein